MKILIKFPSRERPDKFFFCLNNLHDHIADRDNYFIECTLDDDDTSMHREINRKEMDKYAKLLNINYTFGQSDNKIHAVNRDINDLKYEWDIIIVWSDDMEAMIKGFDNIIREKMLKHFPDTDGLLHFNDSHQGQTLTTLPILGEKYYGRFKYIYHHDYISVYCDAEQTHVARRLQRYMYFDQVLVKHNHPNFTRAPKDKLLQKTEGFYGVDLTTFQRREKINFGI